MGPRRVHIHGQPGGLDKGGAALPCSIVIGWSTRQKLSVNTVCICRQPVEMRQLFCMWILDRSTSLPATFCSLILIMSPWAGTEIHSGGVDRGYLNVLTKPKCVTTGLGFPFRHLHMHKVYKQDSWRRILLMSQPPKESRLKFCLRLSYT